MQSHTIILNSIFTVNTELVVTVDLKAANNHSASRTCRRQLAISEAVGVWRRYFLQPSVRN